MALFNKKRFRKRVSKAINKNDSINNIISNR